MEKINIAQLLKDCPQGMELDCTLYDNIFFYEITDDPVFPIRMKRIDGHLITLTKYGEYANCPNAKCIIFPKGKTTWEGFIPPCQLFKDGDIVVNKIGKPFILKSYDLSKNNVCTYCGINCWDNFELSSEDWTCARDIRYATEEEKAKLFDVIKANGYRWNSKAKTLECHPKFKIGDWVVDNCSCVWKIEGIINQFYILECPEGGESRPTIDLADKTFHLWTIQDAKDGDVLSANWREGANSWERIIIFKKYHSKGVKGLINAPYIEGYGNTFKNGKLIPCAKVPYYSTWTDNLHPAAKEQRDLLFAKMKEVGYAWNSETKNLEKIESKFKTGDIIFTLCNSGNTWISIFKKKGAFGEVETYADYYSNANDDNLDYCLVNIYGAILCTEKDIDIQRLATEEEKEKLFQAIKDEGYKWDVENKALEKLKFKVGDRIVHKVNKESPFTITEITNDCYKGGTQYAVLIEQQDNFELVPTKFDINSLIPFESRVLVRDTNSQDWTGSFYSHYNIKDQYPFYCITYGRFKQCIPYEGNEHLLGTTDNCNEFYKTWE